MIVAITERIRRRLSYTFTSLSIVETPAPVSIGDRSDRLESPQIKHCVIPVKIEHGDAIQAMLDKDPEAVSFIDPDNCSHNNNHFWKDLVTESVNQSTGFTIINEATGEIIGFINYQKGYKERDLGFMIHRDYRNKGIMTKAIQETLIKIFQNPLINRITADALPNNTSSIRVLEKVGFSKTGTPYRRHGLSPLVKFVLTRPS